MDIIQRIMKEQAAHEVLPGKKPTRVYLGRNQMKALQQRAYDNGYTSAPDADIEGEHRPEVGGLLCWQVNDNDHLACA